MTVIRRPIIALTSQLLLLCGLDAGATLVIDGNGNNAFQGHVNACFERFSAAGGETAEIMNRLNQPSPDANRHTIQHHTGGTNFATPDDWGEAKIRPDGSSGAGTGTTISWNPANRTPYRDGTPRDPCASLLHEMKHALDMEDGSLDRRQRPAGTPGGRIEEAEIDACREENRFRDSEELRQRTQYGDNPLPPDAMF